MSQVLVQKTRDSESTAKPLLEEMKSIADSIRQRAFSLFQNRNEHYYGSDLEDWLQAERDVVFAPASELTGDEKKFVARIALPGFDPRDVHVSAIPGGVIVQAASSHNHHGNDDGVRFCEFSDKQVYRRLDWPEQVNVDKVTASLDKGILEINAPKQAASTAPATVSAVA
jgi:HSP20 family molecular chaperone IbpA